MKILRKKEIEDSREAIIDSINEGLENLKKVLKTAWEEWLTYAAEGGEALGRKVH